MPMEFPSANFANSDAVSEFATLFASIDRGQISKGMTELASLYGNGSTAGRVEDLSIPTAIVTTDLETGEPYVLTRGPLDVAIRASCAFPGLFEPVEYEGRMLADGCIVAPVPTSVAAEMNASCVLGVAVGSGWQSCHLNRANVLAGFSRISLHRPG